LTNSERDVVASLGQMIAERVGEKRYDLWFKKNTKLTWSEDELVVGVPNRFFQEWLQTTFAEHVRAAACTLTGRALPVRFEIDPQLFQAARRAQAEAGALGVPMKALQSTEIGPNAEAEPEQDAVTASTATLSRPAKPQRRWHRLKDFVVGACNRVAYASAQSVVEAPGDGPNPLVFHGPVGTGKTHLLEGIYAGLRRHHPDWRVCYATSEDFTNRFVNAMRLSKLGGFRKHFRECDALLLDDIHFLASKRATQEEFLHTMDALLAANRPLVVACDCHPRLAGELAPEIVDRLLGGSVWGLAPPDQQCRSEILRAKTSGSEPDFPDTVLRHIAEQLRGNVRELEGALHSVRHLSRVTGRPVDLNLAREAIGDLLRHSVRLVQLADVDRAVCQVLQLKDGSLQSRNRVWSVSHPRMLAMFVARKHTSASYSEIGRHFGGRNHTTAVAAEKKVRQWLKENADLAMGVRRVPVADLVELVERALSS
jgi:chromosomal replication initiator protein